MYFCCAEIVRQSSTLSRVGLQAMDGPDLALEIEGLELGDLDLQVIRDRVEAAGGEVRDGGSQLFSVRVPAIAEVTLAG